MLKKILIPMSIAIFALPVFGQTIGVVDVQKVLLSVKEGKAARAKLEQKVKAKKAAFDKKQKELLAMKKSLQQKIDLMSQQEKEKKIQEYQKKVADLQNEYMKSQQELQQEEAELTKPILDKIQKITTKVAKKHHLKLVVEKSATVFYSKKIDITNEVIRVYNKK